jgi:ABC-type phosphate transport system permease subunit
MQTLFVIFLFSKENIDFVIESIMKISPVVGQRIVSWLDQQKASFIHGHKESSTNEGSIVSFVWNGLLVVMLGYFALSILQSAAVIYAKEQQKKKKKQQ